MFHVFMFNNVNNEMRQMLTYLLECLLTEENCPPESPKDLYELYFVFCCVWAFGGTMFQDQVIPCLSCYL